MAVYFEAAKFSSETARKNCLTPTPHITHTYIYGVQISKHFSYSNTSRSQHVQITEVPLCYIFKEYIQCN